MARSSRAATAPLDSAAKAFAALGDPTRLRLVSRLSSEGPLSISRLTEGGKVTRQAVAKHLAVMAEAGLVRGTRKGREALFELDPTALDEVRTQLEQISRRWDEALLRLKAMVEMV